MRPAAHAAPPGGASLSRTGLRLAIAAGMIATLPVALWWLGGTRLALAQGADTAQLSAVALQVLWLLRTLGLALLAPRVGAFCGWRPGAAAGCRGTAGVRAGRPGCRCSRSIPARGRGGRHSVRLSDLLRGL